jgi:lysophospholipase L1-like esterase
MNKKKAKEIKKNRSKKILLIVTNCMQFVIICALALYIVEIKFLNKPADEEPDNLGNENYVLLGDSLTDWYPISEYFPEDTPIVNSGFAGYKTGDLLNNMDKTVYQYNPTKVFIQMGTNDLNSSEPDIEATYNNIIKVINNVKENRPQAKIYLESIYPVNKTIENQTTEKRENTDIVELNMRLQRYCLKNDVTFLDTYQTLSDSSGNLKSEYTYDGLHLSRAGYSVLSDLLKEYIKEK